MKKSLLIITMKPSILVGGQAVIEGVMMRVPGSYATDSMTIEEGISRVAVALKNII